MSVRKISDSLMIECIMRHCLQILKKFKSMNKIRLFKRIKRRLVFKNMSEITHNIVILINFIFLLGNSLNRQHNAYKLCGRQIIVVLKYFPSFGFRKRILSS